MAEERLQKLMAHAGLCSRREAENWIRDGRVTVNGTVATLGAKADPETDAIKVDGKRLRPRGITALPTGQQASRGHDHLQ
jgi:23S rRNA pseudouridine2605 synthase